MERTIRVHLQNGTSTTSVLGTDDGLEEICFVSRVLNGLHDGPVLITEDGKGHEEHLQTDRRHPRITLFFCLLCFINVVGFFAILYRLWMWGF